MSRETATQTLSSLEEGLRRVEYAVNGYTERDAVSHLVDASRGIYMLIHLNTVGTNDICPAERLSSSASPNIGAHASVTRSQVTCCLRHPHSAETSPRPFPPVVVAFTCPHHPPNIFTRRNDPRTCSGIPLHVGSPESAAGN